MILRNRGTIVVGVGIFVHTLFHTQDTFCFESFCSPTFRSLKASHKTCGGKHLISQNREMNEFGATDRNPVTPNMKVNTQSRECTLSPHAGSNHGPFHYEWNALPLSHTGILIRWHVLRFIKIEILWDWVLPLKFSGAQHHKNQPWCPSMSPPPQALPTQRETSGHLAVSSSSNDGDSDGGGSSRSVKMGRRPWSLHHDHTAYDRNSAESTVNHQPNYPTSSPPWWRPSSLLRRGIHGSTRSDKGKLFRRGWLRARWLGKSILLK